MLIKRLILKKLLSTGGVAEFLLVKREGNYEAALFINGRYIPGPPLPVLLDPLKDDLTHWMGNRPSVGLTNSEAERIVEEVTFENEVFSRRQSAEWKKH